jgi:hypothetical protein
MIVAWKAIRPHILLKLLHISLKVEPKPQQQLLPGSRLRHGQHRYYACIIVLWLTWPDMLLHLFAALQMTWTLV